MSLKDLILEAGGTNEDVYRADAAFFCGTAAEIAGLASLDNIPFKLEWKNNIFLFYSDVIKCFLYYI